MNMVRSLVLLIFSLIVSIQSAYACSCVKRSEVQQFKDAKTVVVGFILETQYIQDEKTFGGGYIRAVVKVKEILKGAPSKTIEVKDQIPEGGMCSSFLRAGIEFVLFINERQEVGMCSGTHPLRATVYDRPEKIKELNKLKLKAGS